MSLDHYPRTLRPWTDEHPPKPVNTVFFDPPTVASLSAITIGYTLGSVGVGVGWPVLAAGVAGLAWLTVRDLVAEHRVRRWAQSPPTTVALDDRL